MPNRSRSENLIQKIAVLYIIIWSIAPPLEIDMIYRYLALACTGVWVVIALKRGLNIERIHIYAVLFAVLVAIITFIERGSLDGILQQIAIYILVVCFIINHFYSDGRWHELKGLVPIVLILLIIYNYRTAQILIEDPTIARRLVRADETVYEYLRQGIGGYSLIYPQVCIFPAILAWILKAFKNNFLYFLIGCVWLFTYVSCIANAGYSIAIFTSIAGTIILLFYKGKNIFRATLITVIIFALGLGAILYLDGVRGFLLEFFDGTAVATKINDLVATSESGVAEGSIYERIEAYRASFTVAFQYPILGGLWMSSGGGHSALLDVLAKFGIWGLYIYGKMAFNVPIEYKKKYVHYFVNAISNAVMICLLFVSILDSFTYSFMCMILIVLPLFYEDIIEWEEASV